MRISENTANRHYKLAIATIIKAPHNIAKTHHTDTMNISPDPISLRNCNMQTNMQYSKDTRSTDALQTVYLFTKAAKYHTETKTDT